MLCGFYRDKTVYAINTPYQTHYGPWWDHYMVPTTKLSSGMIIVSQNILGQVTFLHADRQICLGLITPNQGPSQIIDIIHANTCGIHRCIVWNLVSRIAHLQLPLHLIGDFDVILPVEAKRGGMQFKVDWDIKEFISFIGDKDLVDLWFSQA